MFQVITSFLTVNISQGSVATVVRCGRIFNDSFTAIMNLLASLSAKELRKSVEIWQSLRQEHGVMLFVDS